MSIKWSKEEDQYIKDNLGLKGLRRCTIYLNHKFKNNRTERAVHCRAGKLKCRGDIPPTHYTTKEISNMFGVSVAGIIFNIRSGKISGKKVNSRYLIPCSELNKIQNLFEYNMDEYISVVDFSEKIGVDFRGVNKNLFIHKLPKIIVKGNAYIPRKLCDIIYKRMKQTGSARVDWLYAKQAISETQIS